MTIKALYPNVRPSLDLNFARTRALDPRITFTRASTGTFVGSDGLIKTAASGAARFDHNPVTGESLGLLVEQVKTNSCYYSNFQQFAAGGNPGWNPLNGATATQNAAVAPDNTNTALLLQEDSSNGDHYIQWVGYNPTATLTASIFVKPVGVTTVKLSIFSGASATFNLTNLTATPSIGTALIQAFPNGWYRISVTTDVVINTQNYGNFSFFLGSGSYQGNGTSGVYIWGAQYESGSLTSHIPTSGSTVTRAADVASITGANFSSWYRQDEGVIFAHIQRGNGNVSKVFALANTASYSTNRIDTRFNGSIINANSSTDLSLGGSFSQSASDSNKVAVAYKAGSYAKALNNVISGTSSQDSLPVGINRLIIGGIDDFDYSAMSARISRIAYYPIRLPDAQLQSLTQ